MSKDLDFITTERNKVIAPIVAELGFIQNGKDFYHPESQYFIEFPPGPLAFGNKYVDTSETTILQTPYGSLRIITPTQCVMDRLAWFIHGNDRQARDQAVLVASRQEIDWSELEKWAEEEHISPEILEGIRRDSRK